MKPYIGIVSFLIILFCGCNSKIETFKNPYTDQDFHSVFNPKKISPLKKEWRELYLYLKKGHLLERKIKRGGAHIYTKEFYHYIKKNGLRIYETPFLQELDQFIAVFGIPNQKLVGQGEITIDYFPRLTKCITCDVNSGFGYTFDEKTKLLLRK